MNHDGRMLCKMLQLVSKHHAGQFDRGNRPYVLHVLTVMHRLRTDDEELQCIAAGHDLIEDTSITFEYLLDNFNTRIAYGILSLTKIEGESEDAYRLKVRSNPDAVLVKMEDLRHNSDIRRLKGLTDKDFERMKRYQSFYQELKQHVTQVQVRAIRQVDSDRQ